VGDSELAELAERLRIFARERDWDQFHTPKNLAASITIEAAELQEVFQWLNDEQSANLNAEQIAAVREELADVAIYLIRLADRLEVDLAGAISEKIAANKVRYPADEVRGASGKRP
jgi:NTP pyrophosphatase (non-canonical NTP hydrolase)